eukprot:m.50225 g.50225  ORF g.50225 m.50225 type:complete len:283 (+) comp15121_c0_seq1:35-883(+)
MAKTSLTVQENEDLFREWEETCRRWMLLAQEQSAAELLEIVRGRVTAAAMEELRKLGPLEAAGCKEHLVQILAYWDWADAQEIWQQSSEESKLLDLVVRVEDDRAYVLLPLHQSLLSQGPDSDNGRYVWVHDEEWAQRRFLNPDLAPAEFGLCGQWPGRSKFVSISTVPSTKKKDLIAALGLGGYDTFDQGGKPLYAVECDPELLGARVVPRVPLLYLLRDDTNTAGAAAGPRWRSAKNFLEGTVPGFTSGLRAEVVVDTFQIPAKTTQELEEAGVVCRLLE